VTSFLEKKLVMARSFLSRSDELWLFNNFRSKSNEDLALQLNEKVSKENEEQIKRLTEILKDVSQKSVIRSIQSEIEWRKSFRGITTNFIKHTARRLKLGKKSFDYLSRVSREKAVATNIKRWHKQARVIDSPTDWLHTFRKNETRICLVVNNDSVKKIRNAIFYFNRTDSNNYGFFITSEIIPKENLLRVVAHPLN
jgi:hypothetical protein